MKSSLIQNEACIEASIKVAPDVKIKNIQTSFVGEPVVEACAENCPESSYAVSQMLCVKYSLSFSADVQAAAAGIICNPQMQEGAEQQISPDNQEAPADISCNPDADSKNQVSPEVREPADASIPEAAVLEQKAWVQQSNNKKKPDPRFSPVNMYANRRKPDFYQIDFYQLTSHNRRH